jgi:hypothetical protein
MGSDDKTPRVGCNNAWLLQGDRNKPLGDGLPPACQHQVSNILTATAG